MKCKICGHRANSLPAMSAHYRKKHPHRARERKQKRGREYVERVDIRRDRVERAMIAFADAYNSGR